MVAINEKGKAEIVVRVKTKNGLNQLTLDKIKSQMQIDEGSGFGNEWIVQEVEGNSLEAEVLAVTAREIIKKHIVEPLSEIPLKMVRDINDAWQDVKDRVEKLLQHKFAQCPHCGVYALADALHEDVKFICPSCTEKSVWKFISDVKHPAGGRYILHK